MKLIYCKKCQDVVRLISRSRSCECGASWGMYTNALHAIIAGDCVPLGINNHQLLFAMENPKTEDGIGREFASFIILDSARTVERKTYVEYRDAVRRKEEREKFRMGYTMDCHHIQNSSVNELKAIIKDGYKQKLAGNTKEVLIKQAIQLRTELYQKEISAL